MGAIGLLETVAETVPATTLEVADRSTAPAASGLATLARATVGPRPCPKCGCRIFYRYTSVGLVHCTDCEPPQMKRVKFVGAVVGEPGAYRLIDHDKEMERLAAIREGRAKPARNLDAPMTAEEADAEWAEAVEFMQRCQVIDQWLSGRVKDMPNPKPPKGAVIWHLAEGGKTGRAGEVKSPAYWTYEGAPCWWPITVVEESNAKSIF